MHHLGLRLVGVLRSMVVLAGKTRGLAQRPVPAARPAVCRRVLDHVDDFARAGDETLNHEGLVLLIRAGAKVGAGVVGPGRRGVLLLVALVAVMVIHHHGLGYHALVIL